jgi:hypothetical protein
MDMCDTNVRVWTTQAASRADAGEVQLLQDQGIKSRELSKLDYDDVKESSKLTSLLRKTEGQWFFSINSIDIDSTIKDECDDHQASNFTQILGDE